jgi:hypothetical protein
MTQEHEPIEEIEDDFLARNGSPSPTSLTPIPKPLKPGSATKPRLFRGKSLYDEQVMFPTLKRSKSQIVANLEAEKTHQLAIQKDEKVRNFQESIQLKDVPNLANILTEGDEWSSSSSSNSESDETESTRATSIPGTPKKGRGKSVSIETTKSVKTPPSGRSRSISRADSLGTSSIETGSAKRKSKFRRALTTQPSTPLESVTESPLQPFSTEPKPPGNQIPTNKGPKKRISVATKNNKPSSPESLSSFQFASHSNLNSFSSHEILTTGKILDESMSEVMSTTLDSNNTSLSHVESIDHIGASLVSQLTEPSLFQTDSMELKAPEPNVREKKKDGILSFLFPEEVKDRFVSKLYQKPTQRQEIRARVQEQNRQWIIESERMLESLVSRMNPEIGVHVRRGLRGKHQPRGNDNRISRMLITF